MTREVLTVTRCGVGLALPLEGILGIRAAEDGDPDLGAPLGLARAGPLVGERAILVDRGPGQVATRVRLGANPAFEVIGEADVRALPPLVAAHPAISALVFLAGRVLVLVDPRRLVDSAP